MPRVRTTVHRAFIEYPGADSAPTQRSVKGVIRGSAVSMRGSEIVAYGDNRARLHGTVIDTEPTTHRPGSPEDASTSTGSLAAAGIRHRLQRLDGGHAGNSSRAGRKRSPCWAADGDRSYRKPNSSGRGAGHTPAERRLSCGQTGNRDPRRAAGDVVEADAVTKGD